MSRTRYFNPKRRDAFFDKILVETPSTNDFDLSFSNKLSFNMGELVPIMSQEVYPGDKFNITSEHLIKLAPLVTPVFHKVKVQTHYFFVPSRLLWPNFEEFQAYDTLNTIPVHPRFSVNKWDGIVEAGSLADYLGVPVGDYSAWANEGSHPINNISPLAFSAYWKIIDDYFRDQNLMPEIFKPLIDGDNDNPLSDDFPFEFVKNPFKKSSLSMRCWERDYFTSALPFAQKGQEVVLPLGEQADVIYNATGDSDILRDLDGNIIDDVGSHSMKYRDGLLVTDDMPVGGDELPTNIDNSSQLKVDLSTATSASINSLRLAVRLQEFFERNARIGTRYIEQMLGKFGVRIRDSRAHRSEYIGGTTSPLVFSELLQTSQTDTTPLGQQAGQGQSVNSQFACSHFIEEHGFIIGIMSILPETGYQQGLHKKFQKYDILDYYDPMFANLGEQAVKNVELYAMVAAEQANSTFGYQSRFAELKYNAGEVHGDFTGQLSDWHMSRIFNELPNLNHEFVESSPTHRIFADTDVLAEKVYAYVYHRVHAKRKIPYFSTPSFSSKIT